MLSAQPNQPRLPGRKAQAAVNDVGIMAAAFETLTTDPHTSMAHIANRAGVGVASLYRRYPTRQALVHQLCLHAMASITYAADSCAHRLRDPAVDPWAAFTEFISAALDSGAGAMRALAGTFHADTELAAGAAQMNIGIQRVVSGGQQRGALRADITAADITQFFEMLRAVRIGDRPRSDELRQRYLALFVTALQPTEASSQLPVQAPTWTEISTTWNQLPPNSVSVI